MSNLKRFAVWFAFALSMAIVGLVLVTGTSAISKAGEVDAAAATVKKPEAAAAMAEPESGAEPAAGDAAEKTGDMVSENKDAMDSAETEAVSADEEIKAVVEQAIEKGNDKLAEEADRVPGLKYDDISRASGKIPGKVQVPDPTAEHSASRAISVPGGLVSQECKHFARGFLAKRLMMENTELSQTAAMAKVIDHLQEQRKTYAKIA